MSPVSSQPSVRQDVDVVLRIDVARKHLRPSNHDQVRS